MRRAEIWTEHDHPRPVAAAVRPDNTPEMDTRVEDGAVVTIIERETTPGLRSTVDDYVVNLDVAARTIESGRFDATASGDGPTDTPARDPEDGSKGDADE